MNNLSHGSKNDFFAMINYTFARLVLPVQYLATFIIILIFSGYASDSIFGNAKRFLRTTWMACTWKIDGKNLAFREKYIISNAEKKMIVWKKTRICDDNRNR